MINKLSIYSINTKISSYKSDELIPFSERIYDQYSNLYGMTRMFKGEIFYFAEKNILLGRKCSEAIISAIDGLIYKISFRQFSETYGQCKSCREDMVNFITREMGNNYKINKLSEQHILTCWDDEHGRGNVILEAENLMTAIYITSSSIRYANSDNSSNSNFGMYAICGVQLILILIGFSIFHFVGGLILAIIIHFITRMVIKTLYS